MFPGIPDQRLQLERITDNVIRRGRGYPRIGDRDQDPLNTITLSYTFYRLPEPERPVAEAPDKTSSKL